MTGGEVLDGWDGRWTRRRNFNDFLLDPAAGVWTSLTDLQWYQFSVCPAGGEAFPAETRLDPEAVFTAHGTGAEWFGVSAEKPDEGWFRGEGWLASVAVGWPEVEVVVHGHPPPAVTARFVDAVRARVQTLVGRPCVAEPQ